MILERERGVLWKLNGPYKEFYFLIILKILDIFKTKFSIFIYLNPKNLFIYMARPLVENSPIRQ